MKKLAIFILLMSSCSSLPSAKYEGGLVWGFESQHDSVKCKKGKVIYERYDIYTNFVSGTQCANVGWQCIGPGFNDYHQIGIPCVNIPNKK